jgi:PAS domain S-box-containing protein
MDHHSEKKLAESHRELSDYKYALDESAIVAITDQKGIIRSVNGNFCRISGYSKEELIGQDHRIINSGYHSKAFIRDLWRTIAGGKTWKGELKNRAKNGSYYWVDTTIVPFLDPGTGKPYQYVAIRSDITQRKNAEEEILQKNQQILDILDRITDGFIALDSNFCYTYVNRQIGEMTERDPAAMIGRCIWDEYPDVVGSATWLAFNKAFSEQRYVREEDYYAPLRLWQEMHIYPSPEGLFVFIRNISDQKQAEASLQALAAQLEQKVIERTVQFEQANAELESFSYSVSHDLRAPLRAVHGYSSMLLEMTAGKFDENTLRIINRILSATNVMGKLIDDLLSFSRTGRREMIRVKVNMNALVDESIKELEAERPGLTITRHKLPGCTGDPAMLKQVWLNLIGNAVKYSSKQEHSEVVIGYKSEARRQIYFVKDNGVGFDMAYVHKLFGVFQRLHGHNEFEGTGIGLAFVKKIVEKHDGKTWAESEVGKGASFYFSLPKPES